jgi:hypothetical protein
MSRDAVHRCLGTSFAFGLGLMGLAGIAFDVAL